MSVLVSLIAAVGENGVIGSDNELPWRLPSDFAFFKRTTMGKPVVMGRKTFESIGRPLPGRVNIVVSRQAGYQPGGVLVISEIDAAIEHARSLALADGMDEIFVIGGANIYAQVMDRADRLYITHVAASPEGDARFPVIDPAVWQVIGIPDIPASAKDSASFTIKVYGRRDQAGN